MKVRGGVDDLLKIILLQVSPAAARILTRIAYAHALFERAARVVAHLGEVSGRACCEIPQRWTLYDP